MDNVIGTNVKQYENVVLLSSIIGNDAVLGEDSFIKECSVGNHCSIERRNMLFNSKIGNYTYTGYNCVVKYATIGKFCSISWNVSIGGANHDVSHLTTHPFPFLSKFGLTDKTETYDSFDEPLIIGNDVWIGSNVSILRGVTIGDGAVIGAGAVVTHDIAPYEIWAGVPARKIGQRYDNVIIERMLRSGWHDLPEEFISDNIKLFKMPVTIELIDELEKRYAEFQKRGQ